MSAHPVAVVEPWPWPAAGGPRLQFAGDVVSTWQGEPGGLGAIYIYIDIEEAPKKSLPSGNIW